MIPAIVPITAWRNARYVEEFTFSDDGVAIDLTGYAAGMQVRLYGGTPGSALIDLPNVASDIEGAWIIEPAEGIVAVRIEAATLQGVWDSLGGPEQGGDPIVLVYDLVLTAPDGAAEVWAEGPFTIKPGVTLP